MNFVLMHQTIVPADAIGRDILEMRRVLSAEHTCHIFGENLVGVPQEYTVDTAQAAALLSQSDTVALYHHSIYWQLGESLLAASQGPIVFKYHNITPPSYFAAMPEACEKCLAGREQTYRFVRAFPRAFWLTDSHFNLVELGLQEVVPYAVAPPFIGISDSTETLPNETLLRRLIGRDSLQLLFVSRFAPNKGHRFMLQVLREYRRRFGSDIVLHVAGKLDDGLKTYYDSVLEEARSMGVGDAFHYIGPLTAEDLLSYYLGADVYLCCSEHEGFCVPVIEAQCMCLPVVARARGAVPETAGDGQIALGENAAEYADALYTLRTDQEHRDNVIAAGRRNYLTRFSQAAIEHAFRHGIDEALGHVL